MKLVRRAAVLLGLFSVAGCGGGSTGPVSPPISTIQVVIASPNVRIGTNTTALAIGLDAGGATVGLGSVAWASSAPSIATISSGGTIVPVGPGTAIISAAAGGKLGVATLTVRFGWIATADATLIAASLEGESPLTNRFGTLAYPLLTVLCSTTSRLFGLGVTAPNIITRNGSVAYSGTNIPVTSGTWLETSTFHGLLYPGNNAASKTLANQIAGSLDFTLAFFEFNGGAQAMSFKPTGMTSAMVPVLVACPGANIATPAQFAELMEQFSSARALQHSSAVKP